MSENEHTKKYRNHGVPAQAILDCGLNVFALRLLIESYTNPPNPKPISFPFMGVVVSLSIAVETDNAVTMTDQQRRPECYGEELPGYSSRCNDCRYYESCG